MHIHRKGGCCPPHRPGWKGPTAARGHPHPSFLFDANPCSSRGLGKGRWGRSAPGRGKPGASAIPTAKIPVSCKEGRRFSLENGVVQLMALAPNTLGSCFSSQGHPPWGGTGGVARPVWAQLSVSAAGKLLSGAKRRLALGQTWDRSRKRGSNQGRAGVCRLRSESGVELRLPGDPKLEREGPRASGKEEGGRRPVSLLSLVSSEKVRGRPQGGCGGHGLELPLALPLEVMSGGEPLKRESHVGSPRSETLRARIPVTASMSSAGSIAAGKWDPLDAPQSDLSSHSSRTLQGCPPHCSPQGRAALHCKSTWGLWVRWVQRAFSHPATSSGTTPQDPPCSPLPCGGGAAQPGPALPAPSSGCSYFTCHCNRWTEGPESLQRQRCPAAEAPHSWRVTPQRQGELGEGPDRQEEAKEGHAEKGEQEESRVTDTGSGVGAGETPRDM